MNFSRCALSAVLLLLLLVSLSLAQGTSIANPDQEVIRNPNTGFTVQSGYDGYLLPAQPRPQPTGLAGVMAYKFDLIKSIAMPIVNYVFSYGFKVVSVIALGVTAAAWAFCSYSTVCTNVLQDKLAILKGQTVKDKVMELARPYMAEETMNYVKSLVHSAFDKYQVPNQPEANVRENEVSSQ